MEIVNKFQHQVNCVAFGLNGRMFLSSPGYGKGEKGGVYNEDGSLFYSDKEVNAIRVEGNSLYAVDKHKIVQIDLRSGKIREYPITGSKRLNDIRISGATAYITDSGNGNVYNLSLSNGTHSTIASGLMYEKSSLNIDGNILNMKVNADGIEFTPDKKGLIVTVPFGGPIWKIDLSTKKVTKIGTLPPHGGIALNPDGRLLYSDVLNHRIVARDLKTGVDTVIAKDEKLLWPDAMTLHEGYIYVPAAQLSIKEPKAPFNIFRVKIPKMVGSLT